MYDSSTSLEGFGNTLNIDHKKCLFALNDAMTSMAEGRLPGRWAFGLPTGTGKTRAIIEWITAVHQHRLPYSVAVAASRIEALCTLKRDLVANGVPARSDRTPARSADHRRQEGQRTRHEGQRRAPVHAHHASDDPRERSQPPTIQHVPGPATTPSPLRRVPHHLRRTALRHPPAVRRDGPCPGNGQADRRTR